MGHPVCMFQPYTRTCCNNKNITLQKHGLKFKTHLNMQQKCARMTVKGSVVSTFLGRITHPPPSTSSAWYQSRSPPRKTRWLRAIIIICWNYPHIDFAIVDFLVIPVILATLKFWYDDPISYDIIIPFLYDVFKRKNTFLLLGKT